MRQHHLYTDILMSQYEIGTNSKAWHQEVLLEMRARLEDNTFPCPFARNAFHKKIIQFIFVESMTQDGIRALAEGLARYVDLARAWDGSPNTASPLILAFSLEAVAAQPLERYHEVGWSVLQRLHEIDPMPWPAGVSTDPDHEAWSMSFNGMPLFCNMSHPSHVNRLSRNLGEHFKIVINPRERFDVFAGNNFAGRKLRSKIRQRVGEYDGTPHCLQLGNYGEDSFEWRQYGIIEENVERTDRCPFQFKQHELP